MFVNKNSNYDLLKNALYEIGFILNQGLSHVAAINIVIDEYKKTDILEFLKAIKLIYTNKTILPKEVENICLDYISNTYIDIIIESTLRGNAGDAFIYISKNMGKCKYIYDEYFIFLNNLVLLLNYGRSIHSSVTISMEDIESPIIKNKIDSGVSFSEAIAEILDRFDTHYKMILKISESNGNIQSTLDYILKDIVHKQYANVLKDILVELNN